MAKRKRRRSRSRSVLAIAFDGWGHDVWGIALVVFGLVSALGIYIDKAAFLGRAIDDGTGWLVGVVNVFVPFVAVLVGYLLMRGVRDDERANETVGTMVGAGLAFFVLEGFCHLAGGQPDLHAESGALGDAGGVIGWMVGAPLEAIGSIYGAVLILSAAGLVGALLFTGMPMARLFDAVAPVFGPLRDATARFFRALFCSGGEAGPDDASMVVGVANEFADTDYDEGDEELEEEELEEDEEEAEEYLSAEDDEYEYDDEEEAAATPAPAPAKRKRATPVAWKLPPMSLLKRSAGREIDKAAVRERGRLLERALAEHGVQTRLVGMVVGPTVTRYELELGPGVKVARVTSLYRDIAYAMASPDVRILAPIPGRQAIGVEVPNEQREIVAVGDILASPEARSAGHPLEVAIGRDINGKAVLVNLAAMPHLLIAGATGAGKSSCINSLITSVLYSAGQAKFGQFKLVVMKKGGEEEGG